MRQARVKFMAGVQLSAVTHQCRKKQHLTPSYNLPLEFILLQTSHGYGVMFRVPLLGKAENFTVYIRNFIKFPKFDFSK